MAAVSIPAPGTKLGPCATLCTHKDCAATRVIASACCPLCGRVIGYEVPFYDLSRKPEEQPPPYAHALCVEIDQESRTKGGIK